MSTPGGTRRRPVFLLTDFQAGGYHQGILKATIARLAPLVRVEDLGHGVPFSARL